MSPSDPTTSYPTSNMRAILDEASRQYKDMTGEDITTHPYAAKLEKWDSVDTVLEVFQGQVQAFNEFRKGNKKLMKWLHHVAHTLIAVCGPLGDAVGVVGLKNLSLPHHCALTLVSQSFPPAQGIFVCINVLLTVGLFPNTIACGHVTLDYPRPRRVLPQATTCLSTSSSAFSFSYHVSRSIPESKELN